MGYNGRSVSRVGGSLAVLGFLSLVFGIAGVAAFPWDPLHSISAPIWSGILVFITGCLGLTSGKQPTNKGAMAGFLTMAIVCIFTTLAQWIMSAIGVAVHSCYGPYHYCPTGATLGIHVVNLILGFVEFVLCFVSSILCCVGLCTVPSQNPGTMVLQHPPPVGSPGQVAPVNVAYFTATGQVVSVNGQTYPVVLAAPGQAPPPGMPQYVTPTGYSQPYPTGIATGPVPQHVPELGAQAATSQVAQGPTPPPYTEKAPQ